MNKGRNICVIIKLKIREVICHGRHFLSLNIDILPGTSVAHELNPKIPKDKLTWHGEYGFDTGIIRTDELEERRASDEVEPLSISYIQR